MTLLHLFALLLSFLLSLYGTPIARMAALRFGVMDAPDGKLKDQTEPVPYLGGLAIYLSVLVPLCLFFQFDKAIFSMLLAGTLVVLLGLIDDFGVLTPGAKFVGQLIAAWVLIKGGIFIRVESFPVWLNIAFTVIWFVGITNAINIIDIMDGLAPGVALIACIWLFAVSLINHHVIISIFTVGLIGSLAGFLRYNFHPARIYMGDAGSMFLGLTLGALAIIGNYTANNWLAFFNPFLIFGVAIFDTAYVMVLRARNKRSMFLGSKDHFAVRLKAAGWPVRRIVLCAYVVSATLGALAVINMYMSYQSSIVMYALLLVLSVLIGWRLAKIQVAA